MKEVKTFKSIPKYSNPCVPTIKLHKVGNNDKKYQIIRHVQNFQYI